MSGEASCSKSVGLSSSSAQSHVYIQSPPLKFIVDGLVNLYYDDGNRLLSCVISNQVFSWRTTHFDSATSHATDTISEGPVLSVRFSLDSKVLAIQRSDQEIQFFNRETGVSSTERCRHGYGTILGFFWTDCSHCDIVFVMSSGLDMFRYNALTGSLVLVETKKLDVSWFVYNHESRLVLLGCGMHRNTVSGYQVSSAGVIRLPKFEMKMAKSDVHNNPILNPEDISIVTVYGMIYCLHIDRIAMQIHSYKFYRDGVVQQGSLPIYSSNVAASVVDNVLILHQLDAKVAIIYDIFADNFAPISAPLPLCLRRPPKEENDIKPTIYSNSWRFFPPDIICSVDECLLWKLHLDLESISASSSDVAYIIEFLQRRKLEAPKAKEYCLSLMRAVMVEGRPVAAVSKAMDAIVTSFSHSVKMGTYRKVYGVEKSPPFGNRRVSSEPSNIEPSQSPLSENQESPHFLLSSAISPDEIYTSVFIPVEAQFVGNSSYLLHIILDFLRSASTEKVKVPSAVYVLMVRLLARGERFGELGHFVMNKIIEPSKEVAWQLLDCGTHHSIRALGLEMLRRLSLHEDYVRALVQDGYYLDALRHAYKNKVVEGANSSLLLGAAYASNDSQQLAAVLRFYSDFSPAFDNSPEFRVYCTILHQMASPPIMPISN